MAGTSKEKSHAKTVDLCGQGEACHRK